MTVCLFISFCMCKYACMNAYYMYIRTDVHMYVTKYVCMYVCLYVCVYVCMYVCMYVIRMYVCIV